MTPEEAETKLLAACREAVKRGMRIVPNSMGGGHDCCCPLGALLGAMPGSDRRRRYPVPEYEPPISAFEGSGFAEAFDAFDDDGEGNLSPLGLKFRQLALSGGFDAER